MRFSKENLRFAITLLVYHLTNQDRWHKAKARWLPTGPLEVETLQHMHFQMLHDSAWFIRHVKRTIRRTYGSLSETVNFHICDIMKHYHSEYPYNVSDSTASWLPAVFCSSSYLECILQLMNLTKSLLTAADRIGYMYIWYIQDLLEDVHSHITLSVKVHCSAYQRRLHLWVW